MRIHYLINIVVTIITINIIFIIVDFMIITVAIIVIVINIMLNIIVILPLLSYHHHHNLYNSYFLEISFLDETQAKRHLVFLSNFFYAVSQLLALLCLVTCTKKRHRLIISWDLNLEKSIAVHLNRSKTFLLSFYET